MKQRHNIFQFALADYFGEENDERTNDDLTLENQ